MNEYAHRNYRRIIDADTIAEFLHESCHRYLFVLRLYMTLMLTCLCVDICATCILDETLWEIM